MAESKKWSQMSPQELLDEAQALSKGPGNHMTVEKTNANMLLMAAVVQSVENLTWTLEHRVAPTVMPRP